ncbi:MAG TPA: dihydrofolate reductase family protein [Candidatus Acidoferrum sp.]|jgi:dihydrofolate reductase
MRRIIYAINITADGCCDHAKQHVDEEKLEFFAQLLRGVGLQLFGRKTYELMVPYWPDIAESQSETAAANEFARVFDSLDRIVVSRSLGGVEDRKTRIIRGNLGEAIVKLKEEPGGDILVGGVDVPSQLVELGLVDEFRFVVGPMVVGEGRRLFDEVRLAESLRMKLVETKVLKSGTVALHYLKQ